MTSSDTPSTWKLSQLFVFLHASSSQLRYLNQDMNKTQPKKTRNQLLWIQAYYIVELSIQVPLHDSKKWSLFSFTIEFVVLNNCYQDYSY